MNIAVMAPHVHGNGITTVAALIAAELASRNKSVCLSHVRSISESFFPYFNLKETENLNPKMLTALVKQGEMDKKNIKDYCRKITDSLDLFSLDAPIEEGVLTEEDVSSVAKFILTSDTYNYVIYDVDQNNLEDPCVKNVIDDADCVVLVLTQATTELKRYNEVKKVFMRPLIDKKIPCITVINKYDALYGKKEEIAAAVGVTDKKKVRKWQILAYNRYIPYCENKGDLNLLMERMKIRQAEVVGVDTDVKNICKQIANIEYGKKRAKYSNAQVKGD